MNNKAALLLSLVALLLAGASLWTATSGGPGSSGGTPTPPAGIVTSVPIFNGPPPVCAGDDPISDLAKLMETRVNPEMTQIAYALHHQTGPDRLDVVAKHASSMLGCLQLAPSFPPNIALSRFGEYYSMVDQAQASALALYTAALEKDDVEVRHWFSHMKQNCVGCHARFRTAETE